jgi:WD40 repeat protein
MQDRPGSDDLIHIEFATLGDGMPSRICKVAAWVPPPESGLSGGDVAGLVLIDEGLPAGARSVPLLEAPDRRHTAVEIFGYPEDPPRRMNGSWATLHMRRSVGGGMIQLDTDSESAIRAQPGYSGSPVVVATEAGDVVAGMLAVASRDDGGRDAYAIPVSALVEAWPAIVRDATIPECPYRGLEAFTAKDAEAGLFVGREEEVSKLRQMLSTRGLVVVTGNSGVGKSSLVLAGVFRAVQEDGWETRSFRPTGAPFMALAKAMFSLEKPDVEPTLDDLDRWESRLRSGGLVTAGAQLEVLRGARILLCADQLDRVLDPATCPEDLRDEFLNLILATRTVRDEGIRLVATLRADFLPLLLEHPEAGSYLNEGLFTLSPMGADRLERVITEPAEKKGVRFERELAPLIARDAGGEAGLPLLEFALTELWVHQQKRQLTLPGYGAIGGVTGALSRYAERVYHELLDRFTPEKIRRVMLTLVRSRGGALGATGTAVARELLDADWPVAQALADHRLLVVSHDAARDQYVCEIAHDALIKAWPRFAAWVDDDADFQHWRAIMADRAAEGDTLPDSRLGEADRWLAGRSSDVPQEIRALIARSKSEWQQRVAELEDARNQAQVAQLKAEAAARQAEARRLAAAAELALARGLSKQVSIALAVESLRIERTIEGDMAVRDAIRTAPVERYGLRYGSPVCAVAFGPDGSRLAAGCQDGIAQIVDTATGEVLGRFDHGSPVYAVAFSQDGSKLATACQDGIAQILHTTTGEVLGRFDHGSPVYAVAFGPDSSQLVTGCQDGIVKVVDTATGVVLGHFVHESPVYAVAFSPSGSQIATGCQKGSVRAFELPGGPVIHYPDHDDAVRAVAFSPDGSQIVTASQDGGIRILNAATGELICRLDQDGPMYSAVFSPDGSRVAVAGGRRARTGGSARIADSATGALICRLDHDSIVYAVAFSPDGTRIATGAKDGASSVLEAATGAHACRIDHDGPVRAAVFSHDGSMVATASGEIIGQVASAVIADVGTGQVIRRLDHDSAVYAVVFSRDGTMVATASGEIIGLKASARVASVDTGAPIRSIDHDGTVNAVAFSPDGSQVATASEDASARVTRVADGELACRVDHDGPVRSVAFGLDGSLIATASQDGSARVADISSGEQVCGVDHDGPVRVVAFSPDGRAIATASDDGSARIWIVDHADLVRQAQDRLTRNLTREEWRRYFRDEPYRKTREDLP